MARAQALTTAPLLERLEARNLKLKTLKKLRKLPTMLITTTPQLQLQHLEQVPLDHHQGKVLRLKDAELVAENLELKVGKSLGLLLLLHPACGRIPTVSPQLPLYLPSFLLKLPLLPHHLQKTLKKHQVLNQLYRR